MMMRNRLLLLNAFLLLTMLPNLAAGGPIHDAIKARDVAHVNKLLKANPKLISSQSSDGFTPLCLAAGTGDVTMVKTLIAYKADVNASGKEGITPLHAAVTSACLHVAALLLDSGANPDAKMSGIGEKTPLMMAQFAERCWDMVGLLVLRGAKVDGVWLLGIDSALRRVVKNSDLALAGLMITKGADVNFSSTFYKDTALHEAAASGNVDMSRLLLAFGADVNSHGGYLALAAGSGLKPLHNAAEKGHVEVVKILLEHGATIDRSGGLLGPTSPIDVALRNAHPAVANLLRSWTPSSSLKPVDYFIAADEINKVAATGGVDKVRQLLDRDPSLISVRDRNGSTALHAAAAEGQTSVVEALLARKADVNMRRFDGVTPLHVAVAGAHISAVKLLLARGADINGWDFSLRTPLDLAKDPAVRSYLISEGAHTAKSIQDSSSRMFKAIVDNDVTRVKALLKATPTLVDARQADRETPLHVAAIDKRGEIARALLASKADVHARTYSGFTPLHSAAPSGDEGLVKLVLEAGADVNAVDAEGYTPLHLAVAEKDNKAVVSLLLAKGADVSAATVRGFTSLHIAVLRGDASAAQLLLKAGAKIDARDRLGQTPLHWAAMGGKAAIVEVLLEAGAYVNAADAERDMTPLHCAALIGDVSVIRLLLDKGADMDAKIYGGDTALEIAEKMHHNAAADLLRSNK